MDPITQQTALATAGAAGAGEGLYVDEVFSTYLYEGNGSARTIANDIDVSGEGGLVWVKRYDGSQTHNLQDTERGTSYRLTTSSTSGNSSATGRITSFNTDGFTLGTDSDVNASAQNYVSWTFRKAPGFFDVVTYTGTGSVQTISHNLGSVPGTIIVKRTNAASSWYVYHRSLGATKEIRLNSSNSSSTSSIYWNDTEPTSSVFTVGTSAGVNGSGDTYVAYIFAHDDQSFGENGDQSIIKCGSYTGTGTAGNFVDLGFEPQFLITKKTNGLGNWFVCDTMRGMADVTNGNNFLRVNTSDGEVNTTAYVAQPTGFRIDSVGNESNNSGGEFIYIAIRRPHKPPTAATEVFTPQATRGATDGTPSELGFTSGFPVDLLLYTQRTGGTNSHAMLDRVRGGTKLLASGSTPAESTSDHRFDSNEGVFSDSNWTATSNYGGLMFRRAPGFFDIVPYTANNNTAFNVNHNLGVAPELVIIKDRSASRAWLVGADALTAWGNYGLKLNTALSENTASNYFTGAPTSTQIKLGTASDGNYGTDQYIAYLFATLPGISKVGSYTGTGNDIDIDCGFTSGARLVIVKRLDATGSWHVFDSARGIVAGNDPYIVLDTTASEVTNTDYIDPLNAGFTVPSTASSSINVSGGNYLYLAIA